MLEALEFFPTGIDCIRLLLRGTSGGHLLLMHGTSSSLLLSCGLEFSLSIRNIGSVLSLHQVLKFVFGKQLRPVVDRVYPLSEIRTAHMRLESKEHFGKVIVQCI